MLIIRRGVGCLKVSSRPVKTSGAPLLQILSPVWRCVTEDAGCLELRTGRRFASGGDLHVLGEDGLESLVSVDHGTKHQRLEETERLNSFV